MTNTHEPVDLEEALALASKMSLQSKEAILFSLSPYERHDICCSLRYGAHRIARLAEEVERLRKSESDLIEIAMGRDAEIARLREELQHGPKIGKVVMRGDYTKGEYPEVLQIVSTFVESGHLTITVARAALEGKD